MRKITDKIEYRRIKDLPVFFVSPGAGAFSLEATVYIVAGPGAFFMGGDYEKS